MNKILLTFDYDFIWVNITNSVRINWWFQKYDFPIDISFGLNFSSGTIGCVEFFLVSKDHLFGDFYDNFVASGGRFSSFKLNFSSVAVKNFCNLCVSLYAGLNFVWFAAAQKYTNTTAMSKLRYRFFQVQLQFIKRWLVNSLWVNFSVLLPVQVLLLQRQFITGIGMLVSIGEKYLVVE